MNYFQYLFFLMSLSALSLLVLASLRILDFAKVKSKQKITFIRIGLGMILLALFVFIISRLYPITLATPFVNEKILLDPSVIVTKHQISWSFYIICAYGAGLCIMLLRMIFGYFSAKNQFRSSSQVIIQGQDVFINKDIQSPFSFGLPKAKIYFPLDAEIKWTAREIQMTLAHENVHVEQNDWEHYQLLA